MTSPAAPAERGGGLLAVHAHPDDETLSTGALLATWAAAGLPVTVVTCTRGERGEVIGADRDPGLAALAADPRALAAHRAVELAGALAALGVGDHRWLDEVAGDGPWVDSGMVWTDGATATIGADVPDGAFALVDVEVAADRLARVLVDRRPAVVVGYEPDGGYGHPDHVQAHRVMMRAVELAEERCDDWRPTVVWAALEIGALLAGRVAAAASVAGPEQGPTGVAGGAALSSSVGRPLPSAAVPSGEVGLRVEVAPVLDRVLGALRAHATQVQAVAPVPGATAGSGATVARYALSGGWVEPVPAVEVYRIVADHGPGDVRWPAGVRVP